MSSEKEEKEEKEGKNKSYVMEPEPGHLYLTANTVATVSGSANAAIKTITAEFSERIRRTKITVGDTDDQKKAN